MMTDCIKHDARVSFAELSKWWMTTLKHGGEKELSTFQNCWCLSHLKCFYIRSFFACSLVVWYLGFQHLGSCERLWPEQRMDREGEIQWVNHGACGHLSWLTSEAKGLFLKSLGHGGPRGGRVGGLSPWDLLLTLTRQFLRPLPGRWRPTTKRKGNFWKRERPPPMPKGAMPANVAVADL